MTVFLILLHSISVKADEEQIMPDWSFSSLSALIKKDIRVKSKKIISIGIEGVKTLEVYLSDYPSLSGFGETVVITYNDKEQRWALTSVKTIEQ